MVRTGGGMVPEREFYAPDRDEKKSGHVPAGIRIFQSTLDNTCVSGFSRATRDEFLKRDKARFGFRYWGKHDIKKTVAGAGLAPQHLIESSERSANWAPNASRGVRVRIIPPENNLHKSSMGTY